MKRLLSVLKGEKTNPPPVWFMRQAGRYLPEYREVRNRAKIFIDLCLTPEMAQEVTMQPIRRFGFDAAILFADILLIPYGLGQKVSFMAGEGPHLRPALDTASVDQLTTEKLSSMLSPVFETVKGVSEVLPATASMIGFAGSPWTVATYMIGGGSSVDQKAARMFAYREPEAFAKLTDILVEATVWYVGEQIKAGADVIQLFDSWASNMPADVFQELVIKPTARIVEEVHKEHPDTPIIGYPRGSGTHYEAFVQETGIAGVSLDTGIDLDWAVKYLSPHVALQGNLDPYALVVGGPALRNGILRILEKTQDVPFIFNLGHGIVPETPPDHVGEAVDLIRAGLKSGA